MRPNKIRKLYLPQYQQFQRCIVDFTSEDGRAADRICLIGRNGTGKSTILRLLDALLDSGPRPDGVGVEIEHEGRHLFFPFIKSPHSGAWLDITDTTVDRGALLGCDSVSAIMAQLKAQGATPCGGEAFQGGASSRNDFLVYSPAETARSEIPDIEKDGHPRTTLNAALQLFQGDLPFRHEISSERIADMWRILVYLVAKRENDRQAFETKPESLQKTKAQLIAEFDAMNPPVLEALAKLWNRILEPAGLELDVAGAKIPVQLNENLEAYVRLRDTKQRLPYSALSTGIRNFLFRIGHLFLIYFNRTVERGFVLIDEPENSLFPDFLFELMAVYEEILRNSNGTTHTQLFVATHSPIVAAQFKPDERIVLEWNDDGSVTASKGTAPKGDDPNDLLKKDFHLPELMGPEGVKHWKEYLRLRREIRTADEADKQTLVTRALKIAERYGFEPPK